MATAKQEARAKVNEKPEPRWRQIKEDGDFIRWETPGDLVTGKLVAFGKSDRYPNSGEFKLEDDEGRVRSGLAPSVLNRLLSQENLIGRQISIAYTADKPAKGGTLKIFELSVLDDADDLPF